MKSESRKACLRCAVYTRVSTEHGLEQEFNSLDSRHPDLLVDHRRERHAAVVEPRGANAPVLP